MKVGFDGGHNPPYIDLNRAVFDLSYTRKLVLLQHFEVRTTSMTFVTMIIVSADIDLVTVAGRTSPHEGTAASASLNEQSRWWTSRIFIKLVNKSTFHRAPPHYPRSRHLAGARVAAAAPLLAKNRPLIIQTAPFARGGIARGHPAPCGLGQHVAVGAWRSKIVITDTWWTYGRLGGPSRPLGGPG